MTGFSFQTLRSLKHQHTIPGTSIQAQHILVFSAGYGCKIEEKTNMTCEKMRQEEGKKENEIEA